MTTVTTEGWDLVAVANQNLIGTALNTLYNDNIIPHNISYTIMGYSFTGTLGSPTANFNPSSAAGTNSFASISIPISGTITGPDLNETVPDGTLLQITSNLEYVQIDIGGSGTTEMQLTLDLTSDNAVYAVNLDISPPPLGLSF